MSGFNEAYAFGFYEDKMRALVQLFKYGKVEPLAATFGEMMMRALPRDRRFDAIVAMPMHWRRRWERGFNQAELLAREVSRRSGIRYESVLRRTKATPPQAGLTGSKRRKNVAGAFAVTRPDTIRGKKLLLIDDVLTTGASAGACARVLKRAGAASVTLLTIARADRRMWTEPVHAPEARFTFTEPIGSLADGKSGSLA